MAYTSTQMDDVRSIVNYLKPNGASAPGVPASPGDIAAGTGIDQTTVVAYLEVLADDGDLAPNFRPPHPDNPEGIKYTNKSTASGEWEVVNPGKLLCIEDVRTDPLMEKIRLALLTRNDAFNCSIPSTQLTADAAVLQMWTNFIADCVATATGDASQGDELRAAMANLDTCCVEYLAQATN